ncbi:Uncharacterised protein [Ralstonia pickettii]|jgi:hypothetical protein|uniref:hypothetical protein n=1 Tax=Ralstonia TaxID=48736 RepID=UPI0001E6A6C3|nr:MULTISPECIES: hypothetical protein [Ralstonia]EFP64437.1 hypothetical protein HMPREF1004_03779 [Ralstonia pickettii]EGY64366.1 hypothetical protein HMPREF0989_02386 [Ralstonia sp. 5_2_56FAA]KFL24491.1 hypothetical protein DP23_4241 [Ralstonia pickettii]MBU6523556.1 hypothetical protein [Ralstonia sp. B265]NPT49490.1 hypothetical protein [Ralstonia sp. 3N]
MRKPSAQTQTVPEQVSAIAHQGADEVEVAHFFLKSLGAVVGSIARLNVDTKTPEAARIFALRDLIELAEYLVENGGTNAEHAVLELREIAEGVRHG